ncbi:MAG: c-type cytochrome [Nitrospinales bacterium]
MSHLKIRVIFLSLIFFVISTAFGLAGERDKKQSELNKYSDPSLNLLLAMHFGQTHQKHHGEGRLGVGICPQTRATAKAPDEDHEKKNPLKTTRKNIDAGETLFNLMAEPTPCKICHGVKGNGLGIMAHGLAAMPRNFTCNETMEKITDGQIFWIIRNGSPGTGMPAFKFLTDEQIWQLILYIRRFAR